MKAICHHCTMFCFLMTFLLTACKEEHPENPRFTIGILNNRASLQPMVDTFQEGMAALGYAEGETVRYAYEGPVGTAGGLQLAAEAFVAAKVDLIFALGTPAALAAKRAVTGTAIPIVFAPLNDPVQVGMVKSLTHPGGNITGIRTGGYVPKEFAWLLELAPTTKRVFVPHNPDDEISVQSLQTLLETAADFEVQVIVHEIRNAQETERVAAAIRPDIDAIMLLPTTLALDHIEVFVTAANERKLPLAVPTFPYVQAGALVSYGSAYSLIGEQVSRLAVKILQGVPPADLPVETAEFYLGLNLQTAETIGLPIPNDIVQQAQFIVH